MYTNYNSNLEKNQMMTPPIIGLTSSIVNDKLNNISLEDNSTGLFKIEDSVLKPLVEMPIETNNFIISGTDEEIDSNENNAVNKRYLINKCVGKDDQSVTFNIVNAKRYKLINDKGDLEMSSTSFSFPNGDSRIYFPAIRMNNIFYILADRTFTDKPISLYTDTGIEFNTNANGEIIDSTFQKTSLKNLVTSELTTELRKQLILNNLMDNVCPTYRFCERNYAKTVDIDSVYETLDTKVNNDYLTTNYYDKTEVDAKFPSTITYNPVFIAANKELTYVEGDNFILVMLVGSDYKTYPKYIDMFSDNDDNKFYFYGFDITLEVSTRCNESSSTCAQLLKNLYFEVFPESNIYTVFTIDNSSTSKSIIKGSTSFISKGKIQPREISLNFNAKSLQTYTNGIKALFTPTVVITKKEI